MERRKAPQTFHNEAAVLGIGDYNDKDFWLLNRLVRWKSGSIEVMADPKRWLLIMEHPRLM